MSIKLKNIKPSTYQQKLPKDLSVIIYGIYQGQGWPILTEDGNNPKLEVRTALFLYCISNLLFYK